MKTIVTTLFEGDYHLGTAALINSLSASGFEGMIVCGYRGAMPSWASDSRQLGTIQVNFVALETKAHLTNYKPEFLLQVWDQYPDATQVFYFDPDIVIKAPWSFFAEWASYGVALVEDVNSPIPETHPRRSAWRRCLAAINVNVRRETSLYVNGGFVGLAHAQKEFLHDWQEAMALVGREIGGLERSMFSFAAVRPEMESPAYAFSKTDQDALNIAVMTSSADVSIMGAEGMDFRESGWTMSHALGPEKPWRKKFIRAALAGRPPTKADRAFWKYAAAPIPVFSSTHTSWRRLTVALASLIGRFYRRA